MQNRREIRCGTMGRRAEAVGPSMLQDMPAALDILTTILTGDDSRYSAHTLSIPPIQTRARTSARFPPALPAGNFPSGDLPSCSFLVARSIYYPTMKAVIVRNNGWLTP